MDIPEYSKRVDKVIKQIQTNDNGEVMVRVAINALTMIKQRVQETGINAKGQKFKPYSTKDMLVGDKSFKKSVSTQILGSKAKRKKLEWRTVNGHHLAILEGGYKKWRELSLGAGHGNIVNFSVTNDMWNDINVISQYAHHQKGMAIIGARQDIEKKKLAGNTKRRGDILDLSQKEIEELKQTYNLGELQIFRNNGL